LDKDTGELLDCLKRECPLAFKIRPAAITAGQHLRMACLRLREPAFGAGKLLLHVGGRATDLLVRSLEQFGQRQFDVRANPLDLGESVLARILKKGCQRVLVQPARPLGKARAGTKVEAFNFQVTIRKHFSVTENSLTEFRPVWVQKNEINHRGRTPA